MTIEQLRQQMGADASDAEAEAMAELLKERYGIGALELDRDLQFVPNEAFFALIPDAILRAKEAK